MQKRKKKRKKEKVSWVYIDKTKFITFSTPLAFMHNTEIFHCKCYPKKKKKMQNPTIKKAELTDNRLIMH